MAVKDNEDKLLLCKYNFSNLLKLKYWIKCIDTSLKTPLVSPISSNFDVSIILFILLILNWL